MLTTAKIWPAENGENIREIDYHWLMDSLTVAIYSEKTAVAKDLLTYLTTFCREKDEPSLFIAALRHCTDHILLELIKQKDLSCEAGAKFLELSRKLANMNRAERKLLISIIWQKNPDIIEWLLKSFIHQVKENQILN